MDHVAGRNVFNQGDVPGAEGAAQWILRVEGAKAGSSGSSGQAPGRNPPSAV